MSDIIDSREKRSFPAVPSQLVMSNPGEVFLILNPVRLVNSSATEINSCGRVSLQSEEMIWPPGKQLHQKNNKMLLVHNVFTLHVFVNHTKC